MGAPSDHSYIRACWSLSRALPSPDLAPPPVIAVRLFRVDASVFAHALVFVFDFAFESDLKFSFQPRSHWCSKPFAYRSLGVLSFCLSSGGSRSRSRQERVCLLGCLYLLFRVQQFTLLCFLYCMPCYNRISSSLCNRAARV